ncbi:MAG: hypothetical protein ACM3X5_00795, partial [Bacillota bacterium]
MQGGLDWEMIAMIAAAASAAVIAWDFVAARTGSPRTETRKGLLEVAWPVLFIAVMGLLLKFTDFALFLFICTAVSGVYFAAEAWIFAPRRREQAVRTLLEFDRRNKAAQGARPEALDKERAALEEELLRRPWWVEHTAGFFPVIALVFVLRSFLFEPFRIPSGSMI